MQWHGLATAASHRKFLAAEGLLGVNPAPLHIKPDLSHQYPSQKSELIHKSGLGTGMELGYDASLCCLPCPLLTQKAHSCPIPPLSTTTPLSPFFPPLCCTYMVWQVFQWLSVHVGVSLWCFCDKVKLWTVHSSSAACI